MAPPSNAPSAATRSTVIAVPMSTTIAGALRSPQSIDGQRAEQPIDADALRLGHVAPRAAGRGASERSRSRPTAAASSLDAASAAAAGCTERDRGTTAAVERPARRASDRSRRPTPRRRGRDARRGPPPPASAAAARQSASRSAGCRSRKSPRAGKPAELHATAADVDRQHARESSAMLNAVRDCARQRRVMRGGSASALRSAWLASFASIA